MLRVAYLDFIKFEKSSMIYLPLLENRKKIKFKKITDEKIVLLHILIGYDFYGIEQSSKCHLFIVLLWNFFFPTSLFYTQSFTKNCAKIGKREIFCLKIRRTRLQIGVAESIFSSLDAIMALEGFDFLSCVGICIYT